MGREWGGRGRKRRKMDSWRGGEEKSCCTMKKGDNRRVESIEREHESIKTSMWYTILVII